MMAVIGDKFSFGDSPSVWGMEHVPGRLIGMRKISEESPDRDREREEFT